MADETYFLAGLAANACVKSWAITPSSANALFPAANLQTGRAFEPFQFNAAAADDEIVFDTNIIPNADFELDADTDPPTSWTIEAGTPTVSTGAAHSGTKSLRLNATAEAAYVDVDVVAGKTYRLEAALQGDGAAAVEIYLIDLGSLKYKTSASETSWTATPTALFTRTTASFANSTQTLDVETQATEGSGITTLRVRAYQAGSGTAYVDLVLLYPEVDFASLHDHNVPDSMAATVHSSNDNFVGDDDTEATFPVRRFRTYVKFTPTSATPKRWRKLLFTGTSWTPTRIGQPVLGSAFTLGRPRSIEYTLKRMMPQELPASKILRLPRNLSRDAMIELSMSLSSITGGLAQAVESLYKAAEAGAEPCVIVPDSSRPEIIYGRPIGEYKTGRSGPAFFDHGVKVRDDPFVQVTT